MTATKYSTVLPLLVIVLAAPPVAAVADEPEALAGETVTRIFEVDPGRTTRLAVDNLFGRIRIRAHDDQRIDLSVEKTVQAHSAEARERALAEVSLDIRQEPGLVDLYVNGPFRHPVRREWSGRRRDPGYKVVYDFDLAVPRGIEIQVRTVDGGDLVISGVTGSFDVTNVNGGIEMQGVAGSGSAKTVNGPVRVDFATNPTGDSHFETVNGDVEVTFRAGLSADLQMTTSFGGIWSEWEVQPLASRPPVETLRNGRRMIRTDKGARVRVAGGGPEHSFETFNGDVLIRRSDRDTASDNS